ncbi:unnamed protein product [Periconia digitata]|uniref:Uncharacterized protein n=1 Tax=Periconia digitata TaxID=1303443 RepID=A0A9W4XT07_9PLEO|nr:unnamed protein product [Periconia digitata]
MLFNIICSPNKLSILLLKRGDRRRIVPLSLQISPQRISRGSLESAISIRSRDRIVDGLNYHNITNKTHTSH